jgi:hypothetical protein
MLNFKNILRKTSKCKSIHRKIFDTNSNTVSLPDIASHPNLNGEVVQLNNFDEECFKLEESLKKNSLRLFEKNLDNIIGKIPYDFSPVLYRKWRENLRLYFDCISFREKNSVPLAANELDKVGFLTDKVDVSPIINALHSEIQLLRKGLSDGTTLWDSSRDVTFVAKKVIEDILTRNGYLNSYSHYIDSGAEIGKIYLVISKPNDTVLEKSFSDIKLSKNYCQAYHIDPKDNVAKVMIYLSEVGKSSGPFSIIPGSSNFKFDLLEELFGRSCATANYLSSRAERSLILRLPARLRKTFLFGGLLPDDSSFAQFIKDNEKVLISEEANTILFLAGRAMHRGGLVTSGERIALQVQLQKRK